MFKCEKHDRLLGSEEMHQHIILLYKKKKNLHEKLYEFFEEGIKNSERCVLLTTENDANDVYEKLKERTEPVKVTKYFSYYSIPDPTKSPKEFEEKMGTLQNVIFRKEFQGRIGFNVLGDMTRFTRESEKMIEQAENYLEVIKGNNLKILCSLKIPDEDLSKKTMFKMMLKTHDQVIFEKEDSSFTEISLEEKD